jgi:hypothetical protein
LEEKLEKELEEELREVRLAEADPETYQKMGQVLGPEVASSVLTGAGRLSVVVDSGG